MYCNNCGEKINEGSKFCPKCGKAFIVTGPLKPDASTSQTQKVYNKSSGGKTISSTKNVTVSVILGLIFTAIIFLATVFLFIKFKTDFLGWAIAIVILIISTILQKLIANKGFKISLIISSVTIVIILGTFVFTTNLGNGTGPFSKVVGNNKIDYEISSVVSIGVNRDDLGNIVNGQYFFDDGQNQYYSSFDENNVPHIYKTDGSGKATPIFDGFGWSLVVHNEWLYFSGNKGTAIDGSYNLFRIKTDGSETQQINKGFCYNMSFYKEWLYYIKKSSYTSADMSFYRSDLDGGNEQVIILDASNCSIIFKEKIYFIDKNGAICSAEPDGTDKAIVINDIVKFFIIGNGDIIYIDNDSNIKTAKIDGSNIKTVKQATNRSLYNINSYKDTIFYTYYDSQFLADRSAFKYYLNSIKFDGSSDKQIYEGISYGIYINVVNNKAYVLDYAVDPDSGVMVAIARNMNFDGKSVNDLIR